MRISQQAYNEVKIAFEKYKEAVARTGLRESAARTYLLHSGNFLRWLEEKFIPGTRVEKL